MISGSLRLQSDQALRRAALGAARARPAITPVTLARAIWSFVALGMLACTFGVLTFVKDQHSAYQAEALNHAVTVRLDGVELDFARALDESWEKLNFLAYQYTLQSPEGRHAAFDAVVGRGDQIAWVGFATPDGIVTVASGGLLEGKSVDQRPWFHQGLENDYAGDVHQAVLLQKLLKSEDGGPLRFIDFARPVIGADGQTIGVIGMHINFAWAEAYLKNSAEALGLDVYLVNQAGNVVLSTDGLAYESLDLASVARAKTGIGGSQLETWPDGEVYFTSVLPSIAYDRLPTFGWRMLGRINANEFAFAETNLMQNALKFVIGLGLALLLMTVLFVRIFIAPFSKLAGNAESIAAGEEVYPYEGKQTKEIAQLSTALSLMQFRSFSRSET